MFRSKIRMHTCRIVLLTSLVWLLVDVALIMFYSDCIGEKCQAKNPGEYDVRVNPKLLVVDKLVQNQEQVKAPVQSSSSEMMTKQYVVEEGKTLKLPPYPPHKLKKWEPAPLVPVNPGMPGEMGKAVDIPPENEKQMLDKFQENQFNLLASDMISINRSLPDARLEQCRDKPYPELLPTTSVVVVFHNEAWSTLLRTIWSTINRTPKALLKEIILVDDASEKEHLGKKLEDYVKTIPTPVYLFRTEKRSGLIRARLLGAKHAVGDVITFLDAHCECTEGWLEPLLARIVVDRTTVVCPIIDVISDTNFEYVTASDMTWGGFNWKLNFRWYRVPDREMSRRKGDRTAPLHSPTMAGGLFAIDKEYFYAVGSYDEGMDIWGGENLEMSFRIWTCGGTLEIAPCSRVGHTFRKTTPYTFPGGTSRVVNKNNARLANVWLDDWREFYFSINPAALSVSVGDISERLALRDRLKCKSFRWYLETIYPESQMPLEYYYLGDVRNVASGNCLDTLGASKASPLGMGYCHGMGGNQIFAYTKRHQIMSDDNCLDAASRHGTVNLLRCHGMRGNQEWTFNNKTRLIKHTNTNMCLTSQQSEGDPWKPVLKPCTPGDRNQQWLMEKEFKWQARPKKSAYDQLDAIENITAEYVYDDFNHHAETQEPLNNFTVPDDYEATESFWWNR